MKKSTTEQETTLHNEQVIHRTSGHPFSIHHTDIPLEETCALYLHCHPEAEFFLMEKGSVTFYIENQCFTLHAGDAAFIPPNMLHYALRDPQDSIPCAFSAVVFSTDMISTSFSTDHSFYFSLLRRSRMNCIYPIYSMIPENALLLQTISGMIAYKNYPVKSYELAFHGLLLVSWQELYNLCFSKYEQTQKISGDMHALQKSIDYIHNYYDNPITLSDLAGQSGFSNSYFCHTFKQIMGCSPFDYLLQVRIIMSCRLLTDTDKKITDIALLCGFNNISYYNRVFQRVMNMTPTCYRKNISPAPRSINS